MMGSTTQTNGFLGFFFFDEGVIIGFTASMNFVALEVKKPSANLKLKLDNATYKLIR